MKKCKFCNGDLMSISRTIKVISKEKMRKITVMNIPFMLCSNSGEFFIDKDTKNKLEYIREMDTDKTIIEWSEINEI